MSTHRTLVCFSVVISSYKNVCNGRKNIAVVDSCRVNYGLNLPSVLWSKRVRELDSKFASVDNN